MELCSQAGDLLTDLGDLGNDALVTHLGANFLLAEPLLAGMVSLDESGLGLNDLADGGLLAGSLGVSGRLPDGGVGSLVDSLELLATESLLPLGELLLEGSGVLTLEEIVVLLDVDAHDVLEMLLSVEDLLGLAGLLLTATTLLANSGFSLLHATSGETTLVMGDVEATVAGTLHGAEDTVTGGRADKTDIEVGLEGATLRVGLGDVPEFAISGSKANELVVDLLVLQQSAGKEEASGVGSGVVGKTARDTVLEELLGVSSSDGHVTLERRVDDRGEDAFVGETDDHSVLLGVVLVLVVDYESLASVVVGLSLSSSSEFSLVALGVRLVLECLNEAHCVRYYVFNNVNSERAQSARSKKLRWGPLGLPPPP